MKKHFLSPTIVLVIIGEYKIKIEFKSIWFMSKWIDAGSPIVRITEPEMQKQYGIKKYWEEVKSEHEK